MDMTLENLGIIFAIIVGLPTLWKMVTTDPMAPKRHLDPSKIRDFAAFGSFCLAGFLSWKDHPLYSAGFMVVGLLVLIYDFLQDKSPVTRTDIAVGASGITLVLIGAFGVSAFAVLAPLHAEVQQLKAEKEAEKATKTAEAKLAETKARLAADVANLGAVRAGTR